MDEREFEEIIFEMDDGSEMSFGIVHEFNYDGGRYAVLQRAGGTDGEALIAEVIDPMGEDEEFVPLPLDRQQELLHYLRREGSLDD